jgi:sugar O-acyltransferase (sialic acid O-acetyltransferase NeuD family)
MQQWKLLKEIHMEHKLYIFGASGHAKVVIDILLSNNILITSIVDNAPKVESLSGIKVAHTDTIHIDAEDCVIVAIGSNETRKKIAVEFNFKSIKAVHREAYVSEFAEVDYGTVVMPKAVINSGAKIGKHCIINSGAIVEHDCELEDYVHVSPNASLAGNVTVGEGSHIGIGASVIQGVKIGKWVTIGAGAVVTQDIPDNCTAVGIPAKPIKFH